jgi:hypothetical protein
VTTSNRKSFQVATASGFDSSRESLGTDTMDPPPAAGSSEHLEYGPPSTVATPPTSPPRHDNLVGPIGTTGIQFVHPHRHDTAGSSSDNRDRLRKTFKRVSKRIMSCAKSSRL